MFASETDEYRYRDQNGEQKEMAKSKTQIENSKIKRTIKNSTLFCKSTQRSSLHTCP